MEQPFDEMHKDCWENPERYALVKDVYDGVEFSASSLSARDSR